LPAQLGGGSVHQRWQGSLQWWGLWIELPFVIFSGSRSSRGTIQSVSLSSP
jgi:hypothetical protein